VSRNRQRRQITWTDDDGRAYTDERRRKQASPLGAIPKKDRLLDVYDAGQHHIASLVRNGSAPLLYVQGVASVVGLIPTYALTPDGFALVVTIPNGTEATVRALGEPTNKVEISCPSCRRPTTVDAQIIRAAAPQSPQPRVPVVQV
jgi:hypothetical protein